jgi:hypothetical protein
MPVVLASSMPGPILVVVFEWVSFVEDQEEALVLALVVGCWALVVETCHQDLVQAPLRSSAV